MTTKPDQGKSPYAKYNKHPHRYSEAYRKWRDNPLNAEAAIAWARIFAPWTLEPVKRDATLRSRRTPHAQRQYREAA